MRLQVKSREKTARHLITIPRKILKQVAETQNMKGMMKVQKKLKMIGLIAIEKTI